MTPPIFSRKKEKPPEETTPEPKPKKEQPTSALKPQKSLLEELSKGDKQLFTALSRALLLTPETAANEGIDYHTARAQEYENAGDEISARIAYQTAGQIALYEGKPEQVQKLFKKAAEAEPDYNNKEIYEYLSKKENAERATAIARQFYQKYTKPPT